MQITAQVGLIPDDGGLDSAVVAWASGSVWTHMIVAVGETVCVSAEPGGARVRPISDYPEIVWSQFQMSRKQRRAIVAFALSKVGTPYGWADYLAAGFALITKRRTPNWLRKFLAREDRLICSQLCMLALKAGGIRLHLGDRPTAAVIPADFGKVFVARGWATES